MTYFIMLPWPACRLKHGGTPNPAGGRPKKPSQTNDGLQTADDFGLDRDTIHRWRKRLKDSAKFDAEIEKAAERCTKIAEFRQGGGVPAEPGRENLTSETRNMFRLCPAPAGLFFAMAGGVPSRHVVLA